MDAFLFNVFGLKGSKVRFLFVFQYCFVSLESTLT